MDTSFWPLIQKPEQVMDVCWFSHTKEIQKAAIIFVLGLQVSAPDWLFAKGSNYYWVTIMPQICIGKRSNLNVEESCMLVLCCSLTMLLFTQHKWQSKKWKDSALNCCPMNLSLQIWHYQTYLFPKLKSHLRGCRFQSNNDVIIMCCWRLSLNLDWREYSEKRSQSFNIGG